MYNLHETPCISHSPPLWPPCHWDLSGWSLVVLNTWYYHTVVTQLSSYLQPPGILTCLPWGQCLSDTCTTPCHSPARCSCGGTTCSPQAWTGRSWGSWWSRCCGWWGWSGYPLEPKQPAATIHYSIMCSVSRGFKMFYKMCSTSMYP